MHLGQAVAPFISTQPSTQISEDMLFLSRANTASPWHLKAVNQNGFPFPKGNEKQFQCLTAVYAVHTLVSNPIPERACSICMYRHSWPGLEPLPPVSKYAPKAVGQEGHGMCTHRGPWSCPDDRYPGLRSTTENNCPCSSHSLHQSLPLYLR